MSRFHANACLPRITASRLHKSITELSKIGRQSTGGITRLTFSEPDVKARKYVCALMEDAGLSVHIDQFGNIIGRSGENAGSVSCGSHIDTVPNGGPLDGAYGVLAAIEAARTVHELHLSTKRPIQVIAFTEEEGARFGAFIGSRGFTGLLSSKAAYSLRDSKGITFGEAMRDTNLRPTVPSSFRPRKIKAYLELHIEQGPILERERTPIGVVESIVGNAELSTEIRGKAGHAGTTPMRWRRDALVGASRIVLGVRGIVNQAGRGAVATVGSLEVSPGASNVVPGKVTISVDFRDSSVRRMRFLRESIISYSKRIGKESNLVVTTRSRSFTEPAQMSPKVIDAIETSLRFLGFRSKRMRSGAGHDCQNMARITDTGMIFVPSHKGMSHISEEYTKPEQLEAGANVLLNSLIRLANK